MPWERPYNSSELDEDDGFRICGSIDTNGVAGISLYGSTEHVRYNISQLRKRMNTRIKYSICNRVSLPLTGRIVNSDIYKVFVHVLSHLTQSDHVKAKRFSS